MKKTTRLQSLLATFILLANVSLYAQPDVAAPAPPARSAAKVISFFSDAYANVSGVNFNPNWGQNTQVSTVDVAGNSTLKYANLNYQGTEFASQNALTMNKLHVDVWSSDATSFQITPISTGPKEKLFTCTPLVLNQWNSFDIDLSEFTDVVFSDIFQFKVVGNGTVYIDNLYLYDSSPTVDTEAPTAFTATKGAVTSDAVELLLNATDNSGAVNYTITYGTTTLTTGGVSGTQKSYTITGLLGNTDYSFSVTAKDATDNVAGNSPIMVDAKTLASIPAAPTPAAPAANVISIFSDSYVGVENTNFFPGWGQATVASYAQLAPNNQAIKYLNLNYQGVELGAHVNASAMTKLHVDVYTENETSLQVTPISPGPAEFLVSLAPLELNSWNSFDISLSAFTGVGKADIFQFKFVGSGGKTVYIDNLYFHDGTLNGVEDVLSNGIRVFPTATSGTLNIKAESIISEVVIRNLAGQAQKSVVVNAPEKSVGLNSLPAGSYLVSVKLANGQLSTQKIVKL
ncbi:MAG TPA: T9SS type A sorting domain-containing protein [Paludibacter sp.]|nr:T9SS type A sorting domain-containing protein [Paludibacter sp.]